MKYLVIDTNIWVRVISQGRPGCEVSHLDYLCSVLSEGKITLLLPEVIQLELEKNWRSFVDEATVQIGKLEKEVDVLINKQFWTEIEDVQRALRGFLSEQKNKKISSATERYSKVRSLLKSGNIITLPYTHEVHFRASRRLMEGRMPRPENRAH